MDIIKSSIKYPVTVTVGILLLVMFGILALFSIPIQLTPDVDRPIISVETAWKGASPREVENDIIIEQEDTLKNVEGLRQMKSESQDSLGRVELEFPVGTPIETALLKISNRLQQVPEYPPEAERPVIISASEQIPPVAWMHATTLEGSDVDIWEQRRFFDETIRPMLERIPGVAKSNLFGGRNTIMDVVLDFEKMASRHITFDDVVRALQRENRNFSAGNFDEGKRRYIARTQGQFKKAEDIDEVVIKDIDGAPVKIKDIGKASLGYDQLQSITMGFFKPSLALNLIREPGANVMQVMADFKKTLKDINKEILAPRGMKIIQVYDETDYINSAITLVRNNMLIGGTLAILVLLLFLGSIRSTLVIATAIPVSIIGTMLCMRLLDRNINVISLAGMSFAAGMVVDNSIVVLENIFRHREMGESRMVAAYKGAREVWGAVLASTLTSMAVFIPVTFVKDEAGQIFRDIAIAISAAVGLSLVVSITLIPTLSARILVGSEKEFVGAKRRFSVRNVLSPFARIRDGIVSILGKILGRRVLEVTMVISLTALSLGTAFLLSPKAEYLPEGNRNLVFGILVPPPGYNLDTLKEIGDFVGDRVKPLYEAQPGLEKDSENRGLGIKHYFYWATPAQVFMGLLSRDPEKVNELIPIMREALAAIPGMIAVVTRPSIFARRIGEGRSINIDLTGPDLSKLIKIGRRIYGSLQGLIPGVQVRPVPSLDLGNPEIKIVPDRERLAQLDMNTSDVGEYVDSMLQGRKIDEFLLDGEKIDLKVSARNDFVTRSQDFNSLPIRTPQGKLVRLGDIADIQLIAGPTQINRIERRRAIELVAIPPAEMPLEQAMDLIRTKIEKPLRDSGEIGGAYQFKMAGTADDLSRTRQAFQRNFLLALIITYLLMAALFENWLYPFLIMFTVPMAAGGGFVGLYLVNKLVAFQPLDVLTMLGFVILLGTVVNNAILIVYKAVNNMREGGMNRREALLDSVKTRVRPIVMSTSTSVMAMMPLVLFPGPGSEMYRGIGSVVVGGLVLSTIFTLFLIPAFTSLMWAAGAKLFPTRARY